MYKGLIERLLNSQSSNLQQGCPVSRFCSLISLQHSFILEENIPKPAETFFPLLADAKDKDISKKREKQRTKSNLLSHDLLISFSSILSLFHPNDAFINHYNYSQPTFLYLNLYAGGSIASQRTCQFLLHHTGYRGLTIRLTSKPALTLVHRKLQAHIYRYHSHPS